MKILVAGSRTFTDADLMRTILASYIGRSDVTLINGGAKGADRISTELFRHTNEVIEVIPNWQEYGKSAGPVRNRKMIEEYEPDRVFIFYGPDGETAGTKSTETLARERNIPVEVYYEQ